MSSRTNNNIQVSYVGQIYSGSYELKDGTILVSSPYGSMSAPQPAHGAAVIARELLLQIAQAYRR